MKQAKSTKRSRDTEPKAVEPPELVTCFFSGKTVPRSEAVQVRVAPGRKVWIHRAYCREG